MKRSAMQVVYHTTPKIMKRTRKQVLPLIWMQYLACGSDRTSLCGAARLAQEITKPRIMRSNVS